MKRNANIKTTADQPSTKADGVMPLDFARPADEQIASAVKAAIFSMQLPPGQLISENEIGRMFGTSRTPVRAAFALLREEGLLVTWPSRGTFVTNLSLKEIKAAQFLREAIETTVVQHLAETGLTSEFDMALTGNLENQKAAIKACDEMLFCRLDDQFHALLVEATGHDRIVAALNREKAVLDRLRSMKLTSDGLMESLFEDHVGIIEAIKNRDGATAVARVQVHMRLALDTLSSLVEKNRGYFDIDESAGDL